MRHWSLSTHAGLSQEQLAEVMALQRDCEVADSLDLKLEPAHAVRGGSPNTVLVRGGSRLIGYAGVDMGLEPEICGMVRPAARRNGVAAAMLESLVDVTRAAGRRSVLVICEDAMPVAIEWMQRRGASQSHAEHRMIASITAQVDGPRAQLRKATPHDVTVMTRLLTAGFDMGSEFVVATLRNDEPLHAGTFLAFEDGVATGTLRITEAARRPMIYGFVIDPDIRGRGHGAAMLRAALALLAEWGFRQVGLEVDTTNTPALRLYERFGFRTVTTYRYMRLAI